METDITKIPLTNDQVVALLQMRVRFFYDAQTCKHHISQAYWDNASDTIRLGLTAMIAPHLLPTVGAGNE